MTDTGKCPAFGYDCEYVAKVEAQAAEIERLKREVMLQMGWKTEAQNEVERLREDLLSIALSGSWDECIAIANAALGETE